MAEQTTPANKPENKAKGSDSGMKIHFVPEYGANVLAKNPAEAVKKAAAKFGRKGAK